MIYYKAVGNRMKLQSSLLRYNALTSCLVTLDQDLLLLFQLVDELNRHLQDTGNHVGRRQCQPLREGNVGQAITFVDLHPLKSLRLRCVLNVVTCITN